MKSKIFIAALMMSFVSVTNAQENRAIETNAKAKTADMIQSVGLTGEQEQLVYRQVYVYETEKAKLESLTAEGKDIGNKMDESKERFVKNMEGILDDDQYNKFSEMMKKDALETKSGKTRRDEKVKSENKTGNEMKMEETK